MTDASPDVTFVIAAYNSADTIVRAVESALGQEGVTLEVIVIDDCSSDDTTATVLAMADPRIRLIALETNRGPGGARNAGLSQARGRWIAVLDADDTIKPDRLARMLTRAEMVGAQIVVDNLDVVSGDGRCHRMFEERRLADQPILGLPAFIESNILFRSGHNFGYMKPVFERVFLEAHDLSFDESLRIGEDYLLLASALAVGGICAIEPVAGYIYHIREGSISRVLKQHHVEAMLASDKTFLETYRLDGPAMAAQRRRTRSLKTASAFVALIDLLKQRSLVGALGVAVARPSALWHLRMPIAVRLQRMVASLLGTNRSAKAAPSSPSGKSPSTRKG
ncbi:glycosyltransferase family 2 protein [Rhizobium sp. CG5]|uniref:glycosyltransferase family 2 protein n=1 Tax=Rhizobium sp. CG5 TaxID=2726076 RepID=UPI002033A27A|nr:glycosyltransferase family 2 protein [Rhizobium sp. CG5]MCM2473488.1 glycosyltransferase family 2 protein [Rhizobium sp. CG5]